MRRLNPDSNDMFGPREHDVDRPHSLRGSDVGSPRGPNASLLVGSTWNPHDGSTSDPRMPECRFHVEPTFVYLILSLQLVMNKMPNVLVSTSVTPTAQEMQLNGSNLRIHTCLSCLAYLFKDCFITLSCKCS